jgi:hypothetical protein
MTTKHKCYLWPDHVIGKRESRRIRDEHNAAVNDCKIMSVALSRIAGGEADWLDGGRDSTVLDRAIGIARQALKATGQ